MASPFLKLELAWSGVVWTAEARLHARGSNAQRGFPCSQLMIHLYTTADTPAIVCTRRGGEPASAGEDEGTHRLRGPASPATSAPAALAGAARAPGPTRPSASPSPSAQILSVGS